MKSLLLTAAMIMGFTTASLAQNVPGYVPTNGLVGWWPFNGNANDESGNGNNGTVNGATLSTDRFGNANNAYSFDGNSNFISIQNSNSLSPQNLTLSAWFFVPSDYSSGNLTLLSKMNHSNATSFSYGIGLENLTIKKRVSYSTIGCNTIGGSGGIDIKTSYNTQSGQWNMFLATITNSGYLNLYINGVLINQNQGNPFIACNNILSELRFGQWWNGDNQWFYGSLDDIGIWNRALSQEEITGLYNSVTCSNSTSITPQVNSVSTGATAVFAASSADPNPSYVWQSDFGQGFQTLNNYGNYSGVNTSTISISNVQLSEHQQPIRVISTSGNCIDTSNVARISITDTCINSVNDTSFITVTDTLIINITGIGTPAQANTLKAYPNPTAGMLYINTGNFAAMNGYSIRIHSAAGQLVFEGPINQALMQIQLADFGSAGLYYLRVNDPAGAVITTRKIVLQQ